MTTKNRDQDKERKGKTGRGHRLYREKEKKEREKEKQLPFLRKIGKDIASIKQELAIMREKGQSENMKYVL